MSDHTLFIKKLVYTILLVILPVIAESNSSLPEDISKRMSAPGDQKKPLDSKSPQKNEIILEGTYEFRSDQTSLEIRGKQICFFPNKDSSKKIPRSSDDLRLPWFCFSNLNHAASLLGVPFEASDDDCGVEGEAKIIVSDYEIYKGEGDGNDFAKLIEVLEKSNTHPLSCEKELMDHSDLKKEFSDFETMLKGFSECKFDNLYVDYASKKPLHDYFLKRNLSPYKLEGELAYFHVDEKFMGLSVKEIIIPAGFSVVAIIFEENLTTAETKLKDYLVYGYNIELDPMQSDPSIKWVPELISFHKDKNKSALSCSNPN